MASDDGNHYEDIDVAGSRDETNTTYTLSVEAIDFLRQRQTAKTTLVEQLRQKGFRVSFDLDLRVVNVVCEPGNDPNIAKQHIDGSVFEEEFPVEDVFVRTDAERQSVRITRFRGIENLQRSVTDVSSDTDALREGSVVSAEADVPPTCNNAVRIPGDVADIDYDIPIDADSEFSSVDSAVYVNIEPGATEDVGSIISETKFYCKGWSLRDALRQEVASIERKYNCHVKYNRQRLSSESQPSSEVSVANIEVLFAEIQGVEVDAIVNSSNAGLNLSVGKGLSQILLTAAGQCIQDELHQYHPNGIQPGEVAKSGSGSIRTCKTIYHGALRLFPQDKSAKTYKDMVSACYKSLVAVMINALHMASSDGWKSVAFPALGTGILGYPKHEVVQLMFMAVSQFFESTVSPVEKVVFVIYPEAEPLLKQLFLMENYSWKLQTVKVEGTVTAHEALQKNPRTICETQFEIGRTFLQISNLDIPTAVDVSDAIFVLWQKDHFDRTKGHPVLCSLEPSVQKSIYDHYAPQLQNRTTKVVIDTASWKPARLIHLYCKSDAKDVIVRAIQRGMKQIEKEDITTVTIPVPSDGSTIWQPHIAAHLIVRAVSGLKEVHHVVKVVIEDGRLLEPFLTEVSKTTDCKLQGAANVSSGFDTLFPLDPCHLPVGDIEIHVSSDSEEKNKTAAKDLKDALGIKLMYMIKDT